MRYFAVAVALAGACLGSCSNEGPISSAEPNPLRAFLDLAKREPLGDISEPGTSLGISGSHSLHLQNSLIGVDPIYLADVYNENDDVAAEWLRAHGVFFFELEGDGDHAIWQSGDLVVIPTHCDEEFLPEGVQPLDHRIGCDSASFVFFDRSAEMPDELRSVLETELGSGNAVELFLGPGTYGFSMAWRDRSRSLIGDWEGVLVIERLSDVP